MNEGSDEVRAMMRTVSLSRKKGDALARSGRETAAEDAYQNGLDAIEEFILGEYFHQTASALDRAEVYGLQGGLLRRSGRLSDALKSYELGAEQEIVSGTATTYCRINRIKLALIVGDKKLVELTSELERAEVMLDSRLSRDQRAADDAWLWADLGDVRLLRGDQEGAEAAYTMFVAKATSGSPMTTLTLLEEIASALALHGDDDAMRVERSVMHVRTLLRSSSQ